ncbi:MAG: class I SAM-dependent methyltransferase [Chloroflexi bacterium]|nr:class I SAM-dependent methyltransferase [Chloroflexota bacterium]
MTTSNLESRYYEYLRGADYSSTAFLHQVLGVYLPYFQDFHRILDIGCGHGEFLQLLQSAGHQAVGADIDPTMVQTCLSNGLEVYHADVLEWLPQQEIPFDAIFSSNVMEHLSPDQVARLIHTAFQALRPGGMLLIGVPNPESAVVQFYEFWRDPTHVRLYNRQLLEFFFQDAGFSDIHSAENEAARWEGVDKLLETPSPLPEFTDEFTGHLLDWKTRPYSPPELPAVPEALSHLPAPPADAPFKDRLGYRIAHYLFNKFFGPFTDIWREEIRQQQSYLTDLHRSIIDEFNQQQRERERQRTLALHLPRLEERINGLERAYRFFHPSREVFVYGYKPERLQDAAVHRLIQEHASA